MKDKNWHAENKCHQILQNQDNYEDNDKSRDVQIINWCQICAQDGVQKLPPSVPLRPCPKGGPIGTIANGNTCFLKCGTF